METDAAPFQTGAGNGNDLPAETMNRAKIAQDGDKTMQALSTTYLIERIGHGILNTFLLAAIPAAMIATLVQAF